MSVSTRAKGFEMSRTTLVLGLMTLYGCVGHACEWTVGYFHQVTAIRGRIVGKNLHPFQFGWLRQSFSVSGAVLTLYEFPLRSANTTPVAVAKTGSNGNFDFGPIAKGHYSRKIAAEGLGDAFDVEVTDAVKPTESLLLDISPINPDCTGGHEFIERKAVNAQTH
jgi:hypothetical protein